MATYRPMYSVLSHNKRTHIVYDVYDVYAYNMVNFIYSI